MARQPVFLERQSYRRRRLRDIMRVLPLIGLLLWMIPLIWPVGSEADPQAAATSTGGALTFIFAVWAALVLIAAVLWFRASEPAESQPPGTQDGAD